MSLLSLNSARLFEWEKGEVLWIEVSPECSQNFVQAFKLTLLESFAPAVKKPQLVFGVNALISDLVLGHFHARLDLFSLRHVF